MQLFACRTFEGQYFRDEGSCSTREGTEHRDSEDDERYWEGDRESRAEGIIAPLVNLNHVHSKE